MPKRSSRGDLNQNAFSIAQQVTGESLTSLSDTLKNGDIRREIMREMGRRGGKKGGKARANNLSKAKRVQIARAAAKSRWAKKK